MGLSRGDERREFEILAGNFMSRGWRGGSSERLGHHDAMALDPGLEGDGGVEIFGA